MNYILGKYVKVARYGDGGIIGGGSKEQEISDLNMWEQMVTVAHCFISSKSYSLAKEEMNKVMSEERFDEHFKFLTNLKFLIPCEFDKFSEENRYSRNYFHYQSYGFDPKLIQERLKNATVVIVGCGGIGNHASVVLATAGIGEIILVDNDYIEKTNLTRQVLFTEEDVGFPKTQVIKRELQRRNSEVKVMEVSLNINNPEDLYKIPEGDMWLVSADHPFNLINWINKHCVNNSQPYINAGYVNDISIFGPLFIPGITGCYECQSIVASLYGSDINDVDKIIKNINERYKPSTFAPVNNVAAAMCANDIIKYIGGYASPLSLNKRIGIWSDSIHMEVQRMDRSSLCKICGCRM